MRGHSRWNPLTSLTRSWGHFVRRSRSTQLRTLAMVAAVLIGVPTGGPSQIILMTPIIAGLDGVQKMSKSLGNAIGIHEPAQEMYGKLMSISDELMWRYWILLTDLRQSDIERMRQAQHIGNQAIMLIQTHDHPLRHGRGE